MSRAALAVQSDAVAGLAITLTAPNAQGIGNGNTITTTSKKVRLLVNNTSSTLTPVITIAGVSSVVGGITIPSQTYTIPSQGLFEIWINVDLLSSAGVIAVDINVSVGITWAAIDLPGAYQ